MIVLHYRLYAGSSYRRRRLPDKGTFDNSLEAAEIGVDVHRSDRMSRRVDLDLHGEEHRKIAGRLWEASNSCTHVRLAISLRRIAAHHLTAPAFLSYAHAKGPAS
jgi:hypothetical protein